MRESKMPLWARIVLWPPILMGTLVLFVVFVSSACLAVFRRSAMTVMQLNRDAALEERPRPDVAERVGNAGAAAQCPAPNLSPLNE